MQLTTVDCSISFHGSFRTPPQTLISFERPRTAVNQVMAKGDTVVILETTKIERRDHVFVGGRVSGKYGIKPGEAPPHRSYSRQQWEELSKRNILLLSVEPTRRKLQPTNQPLSVSLS